MTLTDKIKKNWARTAGAIGSACATGYTLLGAFDISRFRNDTWETDPAKAGMLIGATALAAGLTYTLGPKIAKGTKNVRKKLGKLGCVATGTCLTGLAGLGYINHSMKQIGAWDPVNTARTIADVLNSENPVRKRNTHFIENYVINSPIDGCTRSDRIRFPEGIELYDNGKRTANETPRIGPPIPIYITRIMLKTPKDIVTIFDTNMEDHPQAKKICLMSPCDFIRENSSNQRIDQYPLFLILDYNKTIRAEAIGLTGTILACNSNYGPLYTARKITFTDLATGKELFGGPLENIVVPAQGPLHYEELTGEFTLQYYKDGVVRVRTIDGNETTAPKGREHCDKYGYAFEAQLR